MSLTLWTHQEAEQATGGVSAVPWEATGISIDSRTLAPGDLFVALAGPNFDGHSFVAAALQQGAAAAMVSSLPDGVTARAPVLTVDDTFVALQALGRAGRDRSRARVVGVTGSVGKTSIKEALRRVLGAQGRTHSSEGSLNNHWGVPLSLSRLPADAEFAVFEMGMNHAGEIIPLTRQVRPHVAVITTIEAVHIQNFASVDEIADAKAEIFEGLEAGGIAVLNRDNPYYPRLEARALAAGVQRIVTFGSHDEATLRLLACKEEAGGSEIHVRSPMGELQIQIGIAGRHWATNAVCVLAAVHALGADVKRAAGVLADLSAPKGRGLRRLVKLPNGSFELIDDSYNASPPSMRAAFDVLRTSRPGPGGRRIAILGDMLELGPTAAERHRELAPSLVENGIDLVFTAGPLMECLDDVLPAGMRGGHAPDAHAVCEAVVAAVRAGDVVTVKGSAGSRMRQVVEALLLLDAPQKLLAAQTDSPQEN